MIVIRYSNQFSGCRDFFEIVAPVIDGLFQEKVHFFHILKHLEFPLAFKEIPVQRHIK